jgi:hypothetical protein
VEINVVSKRILNPYCFLPLHLFATVHHVSRSNLHPISYGLIPDSFYYNTRTAKIPPATAPAFMMSISIPLPAELPLVFAVAAALVVELAVPPCVVGVGVVAVAAAPVAVAAGLVLVLALPPVVTAVTPGRIAPLQLAGMTAAKRDSSVAGQAFAQVKNEAAALEP